MQGVQSRWGRGSRPIVLALSNPSEVAECTAQQAYNWSGGKAVYASGTAFPPFQTEEGMNVPAQANNSLIFPGILFKRPFACSCKCRMETLHAKECRSSAIKDNYVAASLTKQWNLMFLGRGTCFYHAAVLRCVVCLCGTGVGLGCIAAGAKQITPDIMLAAAKAAAIKLTAEELQQQSILPEVNRIR